MNYYSDNKENFQPNVQQNVKEKNINLIIKVIKPKSKKKPKKERPVETVAGKGYIAAKFLKNNIR